jgi:hypothetical protein
MALCFSFSPPSMTAEQYDNAIRRLEAAGASNPPGRLYHLCFGTGDKLKVVDVWESQEAFQKFGETLMPIMNDIGLDPGQPNAEPIHNIIRG